MATVVVIEEDVAMRTLICEWLAAAGYTVRHAALADRGTDVGLVIADIPNLRLHGVQAVCAMRARYPRAALIGLSTQLGRSLPGDSALARSLRVRRLIAKPLARDELLAAAFDAVGVAN